MKKLAISLSVVALLGSFGAATAQVFFEPFPAAGSPIAGWTQTLGTWTVTDLGGGDTRAHHTGTSHAYLTRTGAIAATGVVEATATGVSNTCNGGVMFRWDSGRQTGIRAYGASSGGMNSYKVLVLEAPGVARTLIVLTNRTKNVTTRILAQGTEVRAQFDVDPLDGKWDYELSTSALGTAATPYGPYSWNASYVDDFKLFDAAIFRRTTFKASNIGTTVPLDLYSPTAGLPYALIAGFSTARLRLANGWFLPVTPDSLTAAVPLLPGIFAGFSGLLDGNGEATANLNVPNSPLLAGVYIYITGVVLDGRTPPGFLHLFNDEQIELIP